MEAYIVSAIVAFNTNDECCERKLCIKSLPIKKIDGINVEVETRILRDDNGKYNHETRSYDRGDKADWTYYFLLSIDSKDFYNDDQDENELALFRKWFGKTNKYKQNDIAGLKNELEEVIKFIKTLRLDTLTGFFKKMSADETPHDTFDLEMYKLLKKDEGSVIECEIEDCSVCYAPTYTTTGCGHRVCMPCINKIEKSFSDTCDEKRQKCPICRETILNIGYVSSDWFNEDE